MMCVGVLQSIMRSWEEMKDFSYVGIKLTKAKTISEGLTKCKIQKLTRQNPVYEHLKFHQLIKGRKKCHLCSSLTIAKNKTPQQKIAHRQTDLIKRGSTAPLLHRPISSLRQQQLSQRTIDAGSPRQKASQQFDRFQGVIQRFDNALRRTKSQFGRMQTHSRAATRYFLTQASELADELDDDRMELVKQARSVRVMMLEEAEAERVRQGEVDRRVKQLKQPVNFPLGEAQIVAIVKQSREKQVGAASKLGRMMCSLYEYKAKANYANKMKVIKQYQH